MCAFALATCQVDATPPPGHPLCGGWIAPVESVTDPLSFRAVVLLGSGAPIVLAALDWTGVLNDTHRVWTERLAHAAGTSRERVSLHSLHQHNAPFVDGWANRHLRQVGLGPTLFEEAFVEQVMDRSASALRESLDRARPIAEVGFGTSQVHEVASTRRVMWPNGTFRLIRFSHCTNKAGREAPEGLIDPELTELAFFGPDERPVARIQAYATHPMSYYGDGRVTPDFVGLARNRLDREEPECMHMYLTGAGGNVAAGKYNNGSEPARVALTDRMYSAMVEAGVEASRDRHPLNQVGWCTEPMTFHPREDLDFDRLNAQVHNPDTSTSDRNVSSMTLSWLRRLEEQRPLILNRLEVTGANLLCLPSETFVEYQLEARGLVPDRRLMVAAYSDGGPWYIPLERSYAEGGYEPTVSFVSPTSEAIYRRAIGRILTHRS